MDSVLTGPENVRDRWKEREFNGGIKKVWAEYQIFPPVLMSVSQNGQRIICMLNPARGGRRL